MALRDALRRLSTSVEEQDEQRLRDFCAGHLGVTPISEVVPRTETAVVGEVTSLRIVPKAVGSPWLEVTITDGDGRMVLMWTGRRQIAGIRPGRRLIASGRAAATGPGGRLLLLNPRYELL